MVPLMRTRLPGPWAEKHPHNMMLPPPCLTVGMVLWGLCASPARRQTVLVVLWPNSSSFVSSDLMTFLQSSSESSKWLLANLRRCWRCLLVFRGTFLGGLEWRPLHRNALVTVDTETCCPASPRESLRSWRVAIGVTVAALNSLTSDLESFRGRPALSRLMVVPVLFHLLMT